MTAFMMVWQLEWQRALRRGRLFRLNIIIPLLLVLPVALGGAPQAHAAAVYAVLFVFFGTFGAAIPALRDAEEGLIRRIALAPLDRRGVMLARAVAGGCIDMLQLLPALAVVLIAERTTASTAFSLTFVLLGTLIFANLIGLWIAALARSVAEGALFAAITSLLLLHAAGVFRTPVSGSMAAAIEAAAPYRALHELLLGVNGVSANYAWSLLLALAVAVCATFLTGRRLLAALSRADGRA